jgi:hypothetical protein
MEQDLVPAKMTIVTRCGYADIVCRRHEEQILREGNPGPAPWLSVSVPPLPVQQRKQLRIRLLGAAAPITTAKLKTDRGRRGFAA